MIFYHGYDFGSDYGFGEAWILSTRSQVCEYCVASRVTCRSSSLILGMDFRKECIYRRLDGHLGEGQSLPNICSIPRADIMGIVD